MNIGRRKQEVKNKHCQVSPPTLLNKCFSSILPMFGVAQCVEKLPLIEFRQTITVREDLESLVHCRILQNFLKSSTANKDPI
uniref:Uncharacterized protein n=1 Tax=Octopus bimaculoides TaxID=37653 RepID=A0A0L8GF69_OCTBM